MVSSADRIVRQAALFCGGTIPYYRSLVGYISGWVLGGLDSFALYLMWILFGGRGGRSFGFRCVLLDRSCGPSVGWMNCRAVLLWRAMDKCGDGGVW